ncbi:MAG TPA: alkaline phosphatase D family protein [Polyangiales bacterium]|nr:alkaline phosphatase D family protein [Polyangiales bacterium]
MLRRKFLKGVGYFVVSASVMPWIGCESDDDEPDDKGDGSSKASRFPQGVASGDPTAETVMLWTRVAPKSGEDSIALKLEVSESKDFDEIVAMDMITAEKDADHTVRVLVEGLSSNRTYYYRFSAGSDKSRVGRTRTAPAAGDDVEPRFAWVSCQDYAASFYGAYRRMLNEDAEKSEDEQLHFVLHIGDFIYETRDADFMSAVTDDLERVSLESADGKPRAVPAFPSGGATREDKTNYAESLDDYRHLYKFYLTDPDLQDARAQWPFIVIWDDHEFTDDCWQSQANYTRPSTNDEPSQKRRVAASQAWFEFTPAALSDARQAGDIEQEAKDFEPVSVENTEYEATVDVDEANNTKAISAITIYRNLRWGRHLELVLTDLRSYRSDHPVPEEVTVDALLIFDPRVGLPKALVNAMDAGREANGGKPEDNVEGYENTRKDQPPGSMLGKKQKDWWKSVMKTSNATFKVWGSSVPVLRFVLDRTDVPLIPSDLLLSDDAWDGYNTERRELMRFLKDLDIRNVVSLSGDHHAHFAGLVMDDFDAKLADQKPVMADFAVAGISSNSQWSAVAAVLKSAFDPALAPIVAPVQKLITYDATELGGTDKAVVNLNTLIRFGSKAANVAAATNDIAKIADARDKNINAHLRYVDTHANGYGLVHVTADKFNVQLVTIERSYKDLEKKSPDLRRAASFVLPRVDKLADLELEEPQIEGKKPFPLA